MLSKIAARLRLQIERMQWFWLLLPISLVVHLAIKQETALTRMFMDPNGFYSVKAVIVGMFIMGIKDIRIISS